MPWEPAHQAVGPDTGVGARTPRPCRPRSRRPRPCAGSAAGQAGRDDLRLLTKHFLAVLAERAPGRAVEVRVPAVRRGPVRRGVRHTRGTPAAVVEIEPAVWVRLAVGDLDWAGAVAEGLRHSGERSDLSSLLPLQRS